MAYDKRTSRDELTDYRSLHVGLHVARHPDGDATIVLLRRQLFVIENAR
jgi:hypothetical protein